LIEVRRAFKRRSAVSGSSGTHAPACRGGGPGAEAARSLPTLTAAATGMQRRTIRDSLRLMARLRLRPMRVAVTDTRPLRPRGDRLAGDHLGTQAHRQWAKTILRASGGVCQWPGCAETKGLAADHRIERRDRPELALEISNGWALCRKHHSLKTVAERARRMRS